MADSTPVIVRLRPNKLAFVDSEAKRLGVPRATVIQMLVTAAQQAKEEGR